QVGRTGIAIIADPATDEALGHRPENASCRKARWEVPFDRRRQPGIAGIAPVYVPARLDGEMNIDPQRRCRSNRCGLGDKLDLDEFLWVCIFVFLRGSGCYKAYVFFFFYVLGFFDSLFVVYLFDFYYVLILLVLGCILFVIFSVF